MVRNTAAQPPARRGSGGEKRETKMTTATKNPRLSQIEEHGVDRAKYPFASFCYGRGWRGHKTLDAAISAAKRDAARCVREHGGSEPQHLVADTASGKTVYAGAWA